MNGLPQVQLPGFFDIGATFIWAITGAGLGVRKGYDVTGVFVMAFVSALGGGLLRDGIFLQHGPPAAVKDPAYLLTVVVGAIVGAFLAVRAGGRKPSARFSAMTSVVDALGLGAYTCVGAQMALVDGLSYPAAIFIGVVNGCGGGLLRDVLVNEIWMMPGQLLALVSLAGALVFAAIVRFTPAGAETAAWVSIGIATSARLLAIRYDWRTRPLLKKG
ncbi:MAG TPA: TRIC cation channel family protein [Candidatus Tumulicola sp.]